MTNARNLANRSTDFVSVRDFGARGDGVTDDTAAIQAAIAFVANSYEAARGIFFPKGLYKITSTLQITLTVDAPLTFFSDCKASLICAQPAGNYLIDVDYSTGATANFVTFNMTNIAITAPFAPFDRSKNGLRLKRVIGSKFTQCEFNFLGVAVDMGNDSNLNTFDTCMWRENTTGWKSTAGVANNNLFLNCQWRYHYGTAFDSTGTGGNIIDGGDFEPYNVSPTIIAMNLIMRNTRYERNVNNGLPGITVQSNNDLTIDCHSAGTTAVLPLFDVYGSNNNLRVNGSGASAAIIRAGAKRNIVDISTFFTLQSPAGVVYSCIDNEPSNIFKTGSSLQSNATNLPIVEAVKSELVPADLTLWTATNCTVSSLGNGGYRVSISGAGATLTYTPAAGSYSNINVVSTCTASNAVSQARMSISGGAATDFSLGNGWPSYAARKVISTFRDAAYTNPVFTIYPTTSTAATYFDIYNLRTSQTYMPE